MKFMILILIFLFSIKAFGQRDTTIYFSEYDREISSKNGAFRYEILANEFNGQFSLTEFNKFDNKWKKSLRTDIRKESDTSYSMIRYGKTIRIFQKLDSGYLIKDYVKSVLTLKGFSKLIFPLIRYGLWKKYDPITGKEIAEYMYSHNQVISTKFWINDVMSYVDSVPPGWTPPLFKGGENAMLKFIAENTQYPDEAKDNDIQGKVIVRFIISSQGEIVQPKVMNKIDIALAKESIKVVNLMKGMWIPSNNGSSNADSYKTIPIVFTLK
jgi:hypothetical protein